MPKVTKIEKPTPEMEEMMRKIEAEQVERRYILRQSGIFIDFVQPIVFKGKKVWALGSRIYPYQKADETFGIYSYSPRNERGNCC
ncbi:hypothetical protein HYW42_00680 [Candidatus Daviesbacteria bacterium]|nr:hypothetical protein [Candidatus Daviesbacteria bacterium]